MISSASALPQQHKPFTRLQSITLVFVCTIIGAVAQILMKTGSSQVSHFDVVLILRNLPSLAGYFLYGINTLLLMLALRDGELSLLYPVIALTYVWVTILSVYFFNDSMNLWKIAGIAVIMAGVTVLGRAGTK